MARADADELPETEGRPVWEAAHAAQAAGRAIFMCAVTVSDSTGSGVGRGKKGTTVNHRSAGQLIESIERMGWRLDHLDHVWTQTEQNQALGLNIIRGITTAHMLFRR